MDKTHHGFSLLELLVVLVIIGGLAGIAVPSYQSYVARSKVLEGVKLLYDAKTALIETHVNRGQFLSNNGLSLEDRNAFAGLGPPESYATDAIERMWIGLDGGNPRTAHIVVVYNTSLNYVADGGRAGIRTRLTYDTVTGAYSFDCNVPWAGYSVNDDYLPKSGGC
ncbi:MAG: pilin [Pseudomonadota bacterium]